MTDELKKYRPPLPELDINDPEVQVLLQTTRTDSRRAVKSSRLPNDWATWVRERKIRYLLGWLRKIRFQTMTFTWEEFHTLLTDTTTP